jgi:hypothetical protein
MRFLAVALILASACNSSDTSSVSQESKTELLAPVLTIVGVTDTTITVHVCGAQTAGAPAGFSLQWATQAEVDANGGAFPSDDGETYCGSSYSGNANGHAYALDGGECVDIVIDGLTFSDEAGGSSSCTDGLTCGTAYAIRAFAHGNSDYSASDKSAPISESTAACDGGCTLTQGYWKNHEDAWPVDSLTLGTVEYSQSELLAILHEPVNGNGLVSLSHQLIATLLNLANDAGGDVGDSVDAANALIGSLSVPPVGDGWLAPDDTGAANDALDAYNNGLSGVPHCEDDDDDDASE